MVTVTGCIDDIILAQLVGRDVSDPYKVEYEHQHDTDRSRGPADDQADEDADDADREADRQKAGGRKVRFLLARLGLHLERLPSPAHLVGFNRLDAALVNDVTADAMGTEENASHFPRNWLVPSLCSGEIKRSQAISGA